VDTLEQMAAWKNVAIEAARATGRDGTAQLEKLVWKNEDDLFAFFDCFRPDGAGVERVFAGVAGGEEIVLRLLKVYECTKESFGGFGYFIVRRPTRATPEKLVDLTTQHLEKVRQIACSFRPEAIKTKQMRESLIAGAAKLASLLETLTQIEIKREAAPARTQPDYQAPETILYDVVGDWVMGLDPIPSAALLMREAFYSIACDYYIANYLMWPLYRHGTDIVEPFALYFELWTHGARAIFEKPGLVPAQDQMLGLRIL
jgi:hypothetical protein